MDKRNITFTSKVEKNTFNRVIELDLDNGSVNFGGGDFSIFRTVIPISSPEYRAKNPSKVEIKAEETKKEIVFSIVDDWGKLYVIAIEGDEINNPIVQRELEKFRKK